MSYRENDPSKVYYTNVVKQSDTHFYVKITRAKLHFTVKIHVKKSSVKTNDDKPKTFFVNIKLCI